MAYDHRNVKPIFLAEHRITSYAGRVKIGSAYARIPFGLRPMCPWSGMKINGLLIRPHALEYARVCKNGVSVYAVCRYHRAQIFLVEQKLTQAITEIVGATNGQKPKKVVRTGS